MPRVTLKPRSAKNLTGITFGSGIRGQFWPDGGLVGALVEALVGALVGDLIRALVEALIKAIIEGLVETIIDLVWSQFGDLNEDQVRPKFRPPSFTRFLGIFLEFILPNVSLITRSSSEREPLNFLYKATNLV